MSSPPVVTAEARAVRIQVVGRVQGLGVRPAVARLASRLNLFGTVANTTDGLMIELEGRWEAIDAFVAEFASALPTGAVVDHVDFEADQPHNRREFRIARSVHEGVGAAAVPLDLVTCEECLEEIRTPMDRRAGYPFTSCTSCGPRYSIVESMPYDRTATTMERFSMCTYCDREYRTATNRRFHSQTNACPHCGPQVRLVDGSGRTAYGDDAITAAAADLRKGRIVALKGLGGYQLLVDATSSDAVRRLRERKRRKKKPFAILVGSLDDAERLAVLNDMERRWLVDPAGPIVVVRRRAETSLSSEIAPGFHSVGLMLPTTPLHALLCDRLSRPLVCTSGNRESEPLVYDERYAERELQGIADVWLQHDRPIRRPIDDSVVRIVAGSPCFLRLARGFAPHMLPSLSERLDKPAIALGGEQKSAIAMWNGSQAVLGPHIGDLTDAAACERWVEQLESFAGLYGVRMESAEIIHDCHPDYFSSGWARQYRRRQSVQHHHAHIAAVLLEHDELDREVLGLAWDGTGYGDDETIWGGECLRATAATYSRIARLRPFPLLGGEQAVRQPWRVAAALVGDALGAEAATQLFWSEVSQSQLCSVVDLLVRPRLSPVTSSMGRLFDAVAALSLGVAVSDYEGHPAMLLEEACDDGDQAAYAFECHTSSGEIDWRPVIATVVSDVRRATAPGIIAGRFHRAVANLICAIGEMYPDLPLVTAGGVFQNAVLDDLLRERLSTRRGGRLSSQRIPPGDGGLAAGQLAVAAGRRLRQRARS